MIEVAERAWLRSNECQAQQQRVNTVCAWRAVCAANEAVPYYDDLQRRTWENGESAIVMFYGPGAALAYNIYVSSRVGMAVYRSDTNRWTGPGSRRYTRNETGE